MTDQPFRNRLLKALSPSDLSLISRHFEEVPLDVEQDAIEASRPISHVHFVESGMLSLIADPDGGRSIEVGIIGFEGFTGVSLVLGCSESPYRVSVQAPGKAHRISAHHFQRACEASRTLERAMLRYAHVLMLQITETARANAKLTVEERLARWLLMAQDRTDGDSLYLTHEFLALMLGVRRPGVTVATHVLEGNGLIRAKRGHIQLLNRAGLEEAARGSYGKPEAEFFRLLPERRPGDLTVSI